ncbi:HK97 gp10 family phage protein [Lachnospiraceae bacterium 54-53]
MSVTSDYHFKDLDKWEKALAKTIEQEYPKEFEQMVIQLAWELQGKVKEKTPVDTGRLQDSWKVGKINKQGSEYTIEVYTNADYADPVEYGHRLKGGKGFVKGKHMMELSLTELGEYLTPYLQMWLNDFLNTHDL